MAVAMPVDFYEDDFIRHTGRYSSGDYKRRNQILAKLISQHNPQCVFEFAGSTGQLAEMILSNPNIRVYDWTDFSKEALELSQKRLSQFKNCTLNIMDIDVNYALVNWHKYDTVISTSLEHLAKDREIISSIKPSTKVFLCLPNFGEGGHVRYFKNREQIENRYGDLMDILWFQVYYERHLMNQVKRFLDWLGLLDLIRNHLHLFKRGVRKKWLLYAVRRNNQV